MWNLNAVPTAFPLSFMAAIHVSLYRKLSQINSILRFKYFQNRDTRIIGGIIDRDSEIVNQNITWLRWTDNYKLCNRRRNKERIIVLIIIILIKNKQWIRKRDDNSEFAIKLPSVDLLQVPGLDTGHFVRQFGMQPFDPTIGLTLCRIFVRW